MKTLRHILGSLGRGWLVVWVLVVPLIHIHPEVDHAHGVKGHVHSAQYHSVFLEDPSYDFHEHSPSGSLPSSGSASESIQGDPLFDHVYNHSEIGFSLLNKSGDDPNVPPGPGGFLPISDRPNIKNSRIRAETYPSRGSPPNRFFVFQHRVRPPPFHSI